MNQSNARHSSESKSAFILFFLSRENKCSPFRKLGWSSSPLVCSPFHTLNSHFLLPDLMEAAEDASLEPAIAWLVQTILATLLVDKLDTWIRQAGFGDDIERLKSEIRRVGMVISAVKGRAIGNEPLAQSLAILKELLYDADDVVDELDYYRLQQQVEGGKP
jgi:hypothetical protein